MKDIFLGALATAVLILLGIGVFLMAHQSVKVFGDAGNPGTMVAATTSPIFVGLTSTQVMASSTGYNSYCSFTNQSTSTVFLALNGGLPAVINQGTPLSASTTYEMYAQKGNLYRGQVNAIGSGQPETLLVNCY